MTALKHGHSLLHCPVQKQLFTERVKDVPCLAWLGTLALLGNVNIHTSCWSNEDSSEVTSWKTLRSFCMISHRLIPIVDALNHKIHKNGFINAFYESSTDEWTWCLCKRRAYLFYPHVSEICIMLHIILMISHSPSQAAIQALCVAQHCSSGRRKETWARLLQARTEWWKTVMWQCCISSIWNDSKLLLSLGTHGGLGQTTTPTWQILNVSWRPLDVASQIHGHVPESQSGGLSIQSVKSKKPFYLCWAWSLFKSSLKTIGK